MKAGLISTSELCDRSGASYRQVDYWRSKGWLRPAKDSFGSGDPCGWLPETVDRARILLPVSTLAVDLLPLVAAAELPCTLEVGPLQITIDGAAK